VNEALRAPGQPLDAATRAFMEPRFGHDFGKVRVHTDDVAAESARAVDAVAYTVGRDIVFGARRYAPHAAEGRRLLAHELTHVVQQAGEAGLQTQLRVGPAQDSSEAEAARMADHVVSGEPASQPPTVSAAQGSKVQRQPETTPQGVGQGRKVTLPAETRGEDKVQVHVIRTFEPCPCRQVADTRTGIFYNPELDNLAIAYRHCRGGTTVDVYGQLQSNATAFLGGQAPPQGTASVGIDVNLAGRSVGGRVVLEALATNEGAGQGVGGRGQIVFQGNTWRLFLEPRFIRRLQDIQQGGTTQNELQLSLGGQIGTVTARLDLRNLLDPSLRSATGTICIPAGSIGAICPFIEAEAGGGVTGGLRLDVPLGGPEVRQERCYQCFCPPPVRKYECIEDVLPREEEITEEVPVERQQEFRYYFRLDTSSPAEDAGLRAESERNLGELTSQVKAGGSVSFIFGYASPEATERHNEDLSSRRAQRMAELIRARVGADVQLPEPSGAGELLGSRPTANPSSRLGDIITEHGFRSAEDLSVVLLGEEIPNEELTSQFQSLFNRLTEPADRLAVFGIAPTDEIAPQVLDAVEQFVQSGGRGRRPWERIFRLLRFGVARVVRTEMVEQTRTERHPGSVTRLPDDECRPHARRAEATGEFGPVDPAALRPTTSSEESNDDCLIEPQPADIRKGCDYEPPRAFRQSPTAPGVAPRRLR
jgi:hypothetical protein